MQLSKSDLAQYELIIWQWGHGTQNRIITMQEMIKNIKSKLSIAAPKFEDIYRALDDLEEVAIELAIAPSPFLLELIEINPFIENRINQLQKLDQYSSINFRLDFAADKTFVRVNNVWFRRLLDILIDNAAEAMETSDAKSLVIKTIIQGPYLKIIVCDTGTGIDDEAIELIFKKPEMLGPSGRGRGAYIAHLIADIYGGNVEIDKTNNTGAIVIVSLPVSK